MLPWADTGFDLYSMSIIASEKTMKERPKVLRAFLEAAYMGWRDVMADPKAALAIFKKRVPEIDLAIIEPNMMLGLDLMRTSNYADKGIGWIDEKKMCGSVDIVNTYMGLAKKVECKDVYTTEFLTKVGDAAAGQVIVRGLPAMPRRLIEIDDVGMIYQADSGPVEALRGITLTVEDGEFVALVGPSGCGKSTLMRIIAGLRPVTSGRVVVDGGVVRAPVSRVGMVFQAAVLLKWRSVLDNVLLPAELSGQSPAKHRARALQLLDLVGLGEFASKQPSELSGGMQQRASLCRALLLDPPILLMDEPFGALDAMTRDEMNLELLRIWGEASAGGAGDGRRKTIVFVTHSIPEAVFLADRVVVMTPRPGRVAAIHRVGIPRPRTVESRATPEFGRLTLQIYTELTGASARRAAAGALS